MTLYFELVISLLLISQLILAFVFFKYLGEQALKKPPPAPPTELEQKNFSILRRAYKKAQAVLGRAELESAKITADSKIQVGKMEKVYQKEMEEWFASARDNFSEEIAALTQEYTAFLADLKLIAQTSEATLAAENRERWEETFAKSRARLSEALLSLEKESLTKIQAYQKKRLEEIDQKGVETLQKALTLVLEKTPPAEQMEMLYEALEQAKKEKFLD